MTAPEPRLPADEALRRLADEHATEVVALYRRAGSCLYVAAACEPVLGYSPVEWRARRPCDLLPPGDRAALRAWLDALDGPTPAAPLTLRVRHRSGAYVWMEAAVRQVADAELGPVIHVSARDVTARHRAEVAARWLGRRVKRILDSAPDPLVAVDTGGAITYANPAGALLLGHAASDLLGRPHQSLLAPDEPTAGEIGSTLRDGVPRRIPRAEFQRRDGARLEVEYACSAIREGGVLAGAVLTFRGIGDRAAADAARRRAERLAGARQTLLALRHEINNPLTTLIAEASLLELGGYSPEEDREAIASIASQARRIRDAVKRLAENPSSAQELEMRE